MVGGTRALCLGLALLGLFAGPGTRAIAAVSPRMLVEISDLSDVAISPDGHSVAFRQESASIERNTYESVWFVKSLDDASVARQVADGGAPLRHNWGAAIIEPPQWSPDCRWIYYRALHDGEVQVWRASSDGARSEQVTHDASDVESFLIIPKGDRLIYTIGASREAVRKAEEEEYDQGIRMDSTIWVGQPLFRSGYINGRLASERFNGEGWVQGQLLGDQPARQRVVNLLTLQATDATEAERANFAQLTPPKTLRAVSDANTNVRNPLRISRSPSTGQLAFLAPISSSQDVFYRVNLEVVPDAESMAVTDCPAAACREADIASLAWRPGHDEVVFTVTDHGRGRAQSIYAWDIAARRVRLVTRAGGLLNGGRVVSGETSCSVGNAVAVCVAADANTPPRLEELDLETGARSLLYDPNVSLTQAAVTRVQLMEWKDDRGRSFTGQFFPPVNTDRGKPPPLFITYYTCPGYVRGSTPGDEWPLASLAAAGIAALCINMPFTLPMEATARYDLPLSAVRSAIDLLHAGGVIDPGRVGMGGLSLGSEVTLWVAMKSQLLAAASVTSTSATPIYYWFAALKGDQYLSVIRKAWGLGEPGETPARWKLLSPAFNVSRIRAPLLMQMPEQEYLPTMDYFVPLSRSSTPTEMYVFPNESHQKVLPRHKLAAYERNLDWFRFWLQGQEDSDPRKRDQYSRWERMCDVYRGAMRGRPTYCVAAEPRIRP